jgi:hypothetical protein
MGRVGEEFMILLDINHVLSVDELAQIRGMAQERQAVARTEAPAPL